MTFNPLNERGIPLDRQLRNWSELNSKPYDKDEIDPYSRCRIIVMNGIEVEASMYSHQFARHTANAQLKRMLATTRRVEQQQQKAVNWLIPGNESTLEVTIGFEQVAVDLTAWICQAEPDPEMRKVYDFGLLEDFDHLYRYANLLDMTEPKKAAAIVGDLTEIMPGRPTILEHRHPADEIRRSLNMYGSHPLSLLHALTVMSAEQQTMNFYMTIGNRPIEPIARALYLEIAQIEEQHVTQYESMMDASASWCENLVLHEYNECYLYYSFMETESDKRLKKLWELHLNMEIEHLRLAAELMRAMDGRDPEAILPPEMPAPLTFQPNKEYVRKVLAEQVSLTADEIDFVPMATLPRNHRYFEYQKTVHGKGLVPSEAVIAEHSGREGGEYRLETEGPHPVEELQLETAR